MSSKSGPVQKYLGGYSDSLRSQVQALIDDGRLEALLSRKYAQDHAIRSDGALYTYVTDLKSRFMRSAEPVAKVQFDPRLQLVAQALGTHTTASRVQGNKLKSKREIRIATLFKEAPEDFLRMIVVHELAHLRIREHDKAFYQLCTHMEPAYHQIEFDLRAWLALRESSAGSDMANAARNTATNAATYPGAGSAD